VKNAISKVFAKSAVAEAEEEETTSSDEAEEKPSKRSPVILRFKEKAEDEEKPEKPSKSSGPKISSGPSNFKMPPTSLLHSAERSEKMQEEDLMSVA